eukprot:NODE_9729_length_1402_cov_14.527843.p1 GENE.NODE_9729_length_1402_cov_14.527843~~NODE_9729_length_1402_cov_14.527843.p1  ORF type:complete len:347 (+),score=101.97 NODE_9729_length_1402_cov_14.527843:54-1094(+)
MAPTFAVEALPFVMVFGGCMLSMVFVEYVIKDDPDAGTFLNATEFVFVLLQSLPGRFQPGSLKLRPLGASPQSHAVHALLWVTMSIISNLVYSYNITVPLNVLFRSCNAISTVVLGMAFFSQRYTLKQVACVGMITIGIFLGSIGDANKILTDIMTCTGCDTASTRGNASAAKVELGKWYFGVALLVAAQVLQATLGHVQAGFYKRFQKDGHSRNELADEYCLSAHIASMFMIGVLWQDIYRSANLAAATEPLSPFFPVPRRLGWVMLNNLTQLACIKGVFRLAAHHNALTVNVTLSVRKCLSVVVSILWFGNRWTMLHSAATVLVFGGVMLYSQCPSAQESKKSD